MLLEQAIHPGVVFLVRKAFTDLFPEALLQFTNVIIAMNLGLKVFKVEKKPQLKRLVGPSTVEAYLLSITDSLIEVTKVILIKDDPDAVKCHCVLTLKLLPDLLRLPNQRASTTPGTLDLCRPDDGSFLIVIIDQSLEVLGLSLLAFTDNQETNL